MTTKVIDSQIQSLVGDMSPASSDAYLKYIYWSVMDHNYDTINDRLFQKLMETYDSFNSENIPLGKGSPHWYALLFAKETITLMNNATRKKFMDYIWDCNLHKEHDLMILALFEQFSQDNETDEIVSILLKSDSEDELFKSQISKIITKTNKYNILLLFDVYDSTTSDAKKQKIFQHIQETLPFECHDIQQNEFMKTTQKWYLENLDALEVNQFYQTVNRAPSHTKDSLFFFKGKPILQNQQNEANSSSDASHKE